MKKILFVVIMALCSVVFVSCSKDDEYDYDVTSIVGTWTKEDSYWRTYEFYSNGTGVKLFSDGEKKTFTYTINDFSIYNIDNEDIATGIVRIKFDGDYTNGVEQRYYFLSADGSYLTFDGKTGARYNRVK